MKSATNCKLSMLSTLSMTGAIEEATIATSSIMTSGTSSGLGKVVRMGARVVRRGARVTGAKRESAIPGLGQRLTGARGSWG